MRKFVLHKILAKFEKLFVKNATGKFKIYNQKNYEYLKGRNDETHIVVDGSVIKIVDYSSDIREHAYYEYRFEYLDDFLLKYFENSFSHIERAAALKELERDGASLDVLDLFKREQRHKGLGEKVFLSHLPSTMLFVVYCFGVFKIKRKEYLYVFTYITTLLAWVLMLSFWVLVIGYGYAIHSLMPLLFISGIPFILNGYIDIEKRVRAKKSGKNVPLDTDFLIGIVGLIALFSYAVYYYFIK